MAKESNLNTKGLALASGIFCGADCLIMGVLMTLGIQFAWYNQTIMPLYQSVLPGFGPSFGGALIGAVEGLVGGAVLGALFAWLYNTCKNKWG
jgi:hypothetical protein